MIGGAQAGSQTVLDNQQDQNSSIDCSNPMAASFYPCTQQDQTPILQNRTTQQGNTNEISPPGTLSPNSIYRDNNDWTTRLRNRTQPVRPLLAEALSEFQKFVASTTISE
jgi:hypothetical protein